MTRRRVWLGQRKAGERHGAPASGWTVRDMWVEASIGDGWIAAFRVFERRGELIVGELRVFPEEADEGDPASLAYFDTGRRDGGEWSARMLGDRATPQIPGAGLTARKLRDVRFEAVRESARELLARLRLTEGAQVDELFAPGGPLAERRIEPRMLDRSQRGRRASHDEAFLADLASAYVDAIQRGSRSPTADTAEAFGYSDKHCGRLLASARERGLLTKTQERRAGGALTEKAREILARKEDE